ncbi:MAG: SDR family oxidoreductase [Gammaproteobacteria bacterium]|nr:SDR family oxidoreductase [Gammaproteobacteria bacterium]
MQIFEKIKNDLLVTPKTWLVTGVAGFIGSNLMETLLKLNQKVVGLDNFATGFQSNIDDVLKKMTPSQRNNFIFHEGDIRNPDDCKKAVEHCDYVLHQAALGSVPRSIEMPEMTHQTNVTGFLNMLIAAKNEKIKRFIYASSSSVYGDSVELPKIETHIGNPLSPYAVSKLTNELYAKAFSNCYGLNCIGLRYFNIFGPRQDPDGPYAAVIPLWITSLLNGQPVYVNGDGETSRDFCYIDNAVQVNLLAACVENPDIVNHVYNVTVGERTSLNQLYQMITDHLSKANQPIYQDFRPGDIRHSLADISKTKNLLGYKPNYNVQVGLEQTIAWFQSEQGN